MNIILIQPNIAMKDTVPYLNHGLAYIAAVLSSKGCAVKLVLIDDISWRRKTYLHEIDHYSPSAILISAYSNQWEYVKQIAANLKLRNSAKIICGGPHVTLFPEALSESSDIDAVVVGEGEIAVEVIIEKLRQKSILSGILGVWTKNLDGSLNCAGVAPRVEQLDKLPFPIYKIYERRIILRYPGITFSRGCPFDCTYCCNRAYSQLYKGQKRVRHITPQHAIDLAKDYRDQFNLKSINIDDDTFTKNPKWLEEFLELYRNEIKLPFNCNARPETINPEIAKLLKKGGCETVSIGIESGNQELRTSILNRNMSNASIISATSTLHAAGLRLSTFNMVGMPNETYKEYLETVDLNQKICPDATQITVYYPYRGTKLGDYCYEHCLVDTNRSVGSYFGSSILKLPKFSKWQISFSARIFKFLVYRNTDLKRACLELTKDIVKALPATNWLLKPYLCIKQLIHRSNK